MKVNSATIRLTVLMCLVATATAQPNCVCLETLAKDLKSPTVLYEPEDGTCRFLIAMVEGVIYVYYKNGSREETPFLDIRDRVVAPKVRGELGLVGLATHPNFKNNNRFYVYYTTQKEDGDTYFRLSQFEVKPGKPNEADPDSEVIMIEEWKRSKIHHAGQLLFDEEGYLYVFIGDNGPQADKLNQGQNRSTIQGSVLRLDVTMPATTDKPYDIPASNPYVGHPDFREEIYAYGLRNPWTAKMDPGPGAGKGRIFIGDVGWKRIEEISILKKGGNYAWGLKEGNNCLEGKNCSDIPDEVEPIKVYFHGKDGNCVIGGTVYRGCLNPSLTGLYIYADLGRGRFWYLKQDGNGTWNSTDLILCPSCPEGLDDAQAGWIYNFGQDLEGEVYVLSTGARDPTVVAGYLQRIVDPGGYEERKATCAKLRCRECNKKINKKWKRTIKMGGLECIDCTCKMLRENKKLFKKACKKNKKGTYKNCCKWCKKVLT